MIKVYALHNSSNAVLRIPAGKNVITFEFTGGNLNLKQPVPATYMTENPIRQYILEHSEQFRTGLITIANRYEMVTPKEGEENAAPILKAVEKEITPVEEVTNKAEAVEYLKGLGVKATSLRNELRIREQMRIQGVSFPNWKEGE